MLQRKTVAESTLDLLNELMQLPELSSFFLVGGTNLSLKLGHRVSVDLDLFTETPFDSDVLLGALEKRFADLIIVRHTPGAILGYIRRVKVDFILYEYLLLEPIEVIDDIRLASLPDVVAMKINAISRRGVQKDFWDIAELLDHFSLEQMLLFFKQKHTATDVGHILRSLIYFADADGSEPPLSLKKHNWNSVKEKIKRAVRDYIKAQTQG
ncbi:nucleotidyl transferase AbiEii/AbiGii toxin family protein [Salmonirosea aquatica]|uniref:Nucleotidyl transferase AbiEii/AbiGii toxin family protein n=1 Tax=Salmonirosea aquatica TaxID=2654236 RepID=A0A7C9BDW2_9BACT|nr:hypothetical protein [Cytophagaceae bacterium SJW1-29]